MLCDAGADPDTGRTYTPAAGLPYPAPFDPHYRKASRPAAGDAAGIVTTVGMMVESFSAVAIWFASHPEIVARIVLGSILLALVSVAVLVAAVIKMSPDYFVAAGPPRGSWRRRHPLLRIVFKILKSLAGLVLLIAGIVMLVLPGQGLLTILIGLSLIEFPGKRSMELAIVRERHVLKTINWIRARARQAPVVVVAPPSPRAD